jgi:hypothetical protein
VRWNREWNYVATISRPHYLEADVDLASSASVAR